MRLPNPSPELDKNRARLGPEMLCSTGAEVWRKQPPGAFPDSHSELDKFRSAILGHVGVTFKLFGRRSPGLQF